MLPDFKKSEADPRLTSVLPTPPSLKAAQRAQAPSPRASENSGPSVVGPDLVITGNLSTTGELQIEGEVKGDIHCSHIVVGEHATITGGIVADEAVIRGRVMGSVRGKRVVLQSSSHVEGDIYHQSLAIEQGAYFEGKSRRTTDDPTANVPMTEQPAVSPKRMSAVAG